MKLIYLRKSKNEYIFREATASEIFANHVISKLLGKIFSITIPDDKIVEVEFNENKNKNVRNE